MATLYPTTVVISQDTSLPRPASTDSQACPISPFLYLVPTFTQPPNVPFRVLDAALHALKRSLCVWSVCMVCPRVWSACVACLHGPPVLCPSRTLTAFLPLLP